MSTFDGFISEFPNIRIDYFRTQPHRPPALACFLSHIHSDHLAGLESLKSPFVYCSPSTRELLLRLEKFPHRMNFSRGILECRKETYKHLKTLLKPIPLDTPTKIELSPGNDVQVTLFDANHCAGAVMFLIEGNGKAILYTGDVRSEEWWVNALARHPKLVKQDSYRHFPSKASGIQELLQKLEKYPPSTVFYFQAWTFGYEDVWLALSQALNSRIHLDRYRYRLYTSVSRNTGYGLECREAPVLCGFKIGNTRHPGILTEDQSVRIHSCERGTGCHVCDEATDIVTITPIISRHAGVEMRELGAGGGQGDLNQIHQLDISDPMAVAYLLDLCAKQIKNKTVLNRIGELLVSSLLDRTGGQLQLGLTRDEDEDVLLNKDAVPLDQVPKLIAEVAVRYRDWTKARSKDSTALSATELDMKPPSLKGVELPRSITFPYSRHSSYDELRLLVGAFRPRSVFPCTVPSESQWTEEISMVSLFGDLCERKGREFAFDVDMRARVQETRAKKRKRMTLGEDGEGTDDEMEQVPKSTPARGDMECDATASPPARAICPEPLSVIPPAKLLKSPIEIPIKASLLQKSPIEIISDTEDEDDGVAKIASISAIQPHPDNTIVANRAPTLSIITISPPSSRERYRARIAAGQAAVEGTWHSIGLSSVKRGDVCGIGIGSGEQEEEEL